MRLARWICYRRHLARLMRERLEAGYKLTGWQEARMAEEARRLAGYPPGEV